MACAFWGAAVVVMAATVEIDTSAFPLIWVKKDRREGVDCFEDDTQLGLEVEGSPFIRSIVIPPYAVVNFVVVVARRHITKHSIKVFIAVWAW